VLARTASIVSKNALPDCAVPTLSVPTTAKPCSKPDSSRPDIKLSTLAATCTSTSAASGVSAPSLSLDNKRPKRPSARFLQVMSPSPPRSDLSEISCELLNVRSLNSKSLRICDDLLRNDIDVFMLTETWLKPCSGATISECTPNGYSLLQGDRNDKAGGGVAVIARDSLGCTEVFMSHGSTVESLVVRLSNPQLSLITVIYRPTSTPVAQFFRDFSELLTQILLGKRPVTLAGDFNIPVNDLNDPNAKSFFDILSVFGLSQHIKDSTHCGGHTLDLLITHDVSLHIIYLTTALCHSRCPPHNHSTATFIYHNN